MARVLYFDCFSGISGDMVLGALLDAGLPLDELKRALGSLAVSGYDISAAKVMRAGIAATKFIVREHGRVDDSGGARPHEHVGHSHEQGGHSHDDGVVHARHVADAGEHVGHADNRGTAAAENVGHSHDHSTDATQHIGHASQHSEGHHHPHRSLAEIDHLIDGSALSAAGKDRAKALFHRLAEAEAAIHQMPIEKVHLHEVGALDSIIDIVGAVFALEWFAADDVLASPLNVGGGMVQSAHGLFPVPAPATVKLLGTTPIYSGDVQRELVTPTGALIATSYAKSFGRLPPMAVEAVGYGAGDADFKATPNVLRVLVGRTAHAAATETVTVVECEIDDMNPQLYGAVMDRLYAAGALEVFYVPVQMKKNRPGTLLTVIVAPDRRAEIVDVIFRETTTIGLRYSEVSRECLAREILPIETPLGSVRFKVARRDGRVLNATPEFEDCARLAAANNLPVKQVQQIAMRAFGDRP